MPAAKPLTTILSSEGHVALPAAVRERHGWETGLQLVVEDGTDGVLLKRPASEPLFEPTRLEDVRGMLKCEGPPLTIKQMDQVVLDEAARRWKLFERTGSDYEVDELP